MQELKSETELIQADAYSYILQNNIKYDLICIDIFVDDKIPQVFLDLDFLEDASENLSENGFIMFNHLALTKNDIESAVDYFNQVFKIAFPNSINLNVKGNCMMISDSNKIKKPDFI